MLESRVSALEEENARLRAALDAQKVAPPSSMTAPYSVIGDRMQSTATLPTPEQGRPRQPERSGPSSSMERSTRTASDASGSRFSGVRPPLPHHPTPVSVRVSHRAGSSSPLGPRGNASLGEAVATIAEVSGGTPRAVPTPLEQPPHPRRPPALSAQGTAPSMMEQTLASGAAPDSSAASGPTRPMASFARFLTVEIPGGGTACPEETLASADTPQDQVIPAVASPDVKQQPPGSGGTGSSGASAAARRSTTPGATHGFPWPLGGRGGPGSSLALSDEALLAWSPSSAVSAAAATIARATTSDGSPSPLSLLLSSPGPSHVRRKRDRRGGGGGGEGKGRRAADGGRQALSLRIRGSSRTALSPMATRHTSAADPFPRP